MRHFRPYLAWLLLVAAVAIALPRTWIHHCTDLQSEQLAHNMDDTHAQVSHENCPICDYAPASSLTPTLVVALLAPMPMAAPETPIHQVFSSPQVLPSAQRGPPTA